MELLPALISFHLGCMGFASSHHSLERQRHKFMVSSHPLPVSSATLLQYLEDRISERKTVWLCVVKMPSVTQSLPKLRLVGAAVIRINKGIAINSSSLSIQEIVIGRKNLGQTCILCYLIESNRALEDV